MLCYDRLGGGEIRSAVFFRASSNVVHITIDGVEEKILIGHCPAAEVEEPLTLHCQLKPSFVPDRCACIVLIEGGWIQANPVISPSDGRIIDGYRCTGAVSARALGARSRPCTDLIDDGYGVGDGTRFHLSFSQQQEHIRIAEDVNVHGILLRGGPSTG